MENNVDIQNRSAIEKAIAGALKSAIDAHGAIDKKNLNSATKRVYGALKNTARGQRDKKKAKALLPIQIHNPRKREQQNLNHAQEI